METQNTDQNITQIFEQYGLTVKKKYVHITFTDLDGLIKEYGLTKPLFVWSKIKKQEDLFHCNKEFIKGRLSESFYHAGPLEDDSKSLIPNLLKLHDVGVFTFGGQGSLIEHDKWIDNEFKDYNGRICGKWYSAIEQKPFLECLIHQKYITKLIEYIDTRNKLNNINNEKINYIIMEDGKPNKTNMVEEEYNVTREKSYKELSQKEKTKWENYTNIHPFSTEDYIFELGETFPFKKIMCDYVVLTLSASNYGSEMNIEEILLDFFNFAT